VLLPNDLPELYRMSLKSSPIYLKPIAIFGAGGLGREVLMLLHQINQAVPQWQILGFYDDDANPLPSILNFPYLGNLADLQKSNQDLAIVIAIANPVIKAQIRAKLNFPTITFPTLIHPTVINEAFQFNTIGEGTIICQGTILTTNIEIGKHVLLNLSCTIGHDTVINDFCALMPQANISGKVVLKQGVYLGANATVLPGIGIGENSIIGAGAVVTQPIPPKCTAVGVPARIIKKHVE